LRDYAYEKQAPREEKYGIEIGALIMFACFNQLASRKIACRQFLNNRIQIRNINQMDNKSRKNYYN
jgi:hypothetical protein